MKTCLRHGTIALALVLGVGMAAAQSGSPGADTERPGARMNQPSQVQLSPTQKSAILKAVRQDGAEIKSPAKFQASIGAPVPPAAELHPLPSSALAEAPEAKSLQYTMVQNQLVLVDPTTMRVVDIIRQ